MAQSALPQTLPELALSLAQRGDRVAFRFARNDAWTELSYAAVGEAVSEITRGLVALGVAPGDRVALLSATRPEWTLADLGTLGAGAVVVPIYHSDSPEECQYILTHSESRLLFCEDEEQLAKVSEVRSRCPRLEQVVMLTGSGPGTISLHELRERGRQVDVEAAAGIAAGIRPDDIATIVYTSGTTGPPKG
ncbi:MAG: AMP-binding protein, partial [Solirubrobacteraceae bacterium]